MWVLSLIPRSLPSGVCGKCAAWSLAMVLRWQWETADARPQRSARNNTCSPSDGDNSVRKLWQLLEIWDTVLMDKSIQRAKCALAVLRALDNFQGTVWQEIKGKYLPEVLFCQQCTWMVSAFLRNDLVSKRYGGSTSSFYFTELKFSTYHEIWCTMHVPEKAPENQTTYTLPWDSKIIFHRYIL